MRAESVGADNCEKEQSKGLSFGRAFDRIRLASQKGSGLGFTAMRLHFWKEDVKIKVQVPDENSKMTAPYLYVESRFGRVPWKETMLELFSTDWELTD